MNLVVAVPYFLLTRGIYTGIINAVGIATANSCRIISSVVKKKNYNLRRIQKLDISKKLELIKTFLKNIYQDLPEHTAVSSKIDENLGKSYYHERSLFEICFYNINESIQKLEKKLESLEFKIRHHEKKWFHYYRSVKIEPLIQDIETEYEILSNRFDDFLKISQLMLFVENKK